MVKGAFQTAAYKTHNWDGKESQFNTDGSTYEFMLDKLTPILSELGYNLDTIQIIDNRTKVPPEFEPIDDSFFPRFGYDSRYYQVEAVNIALKAQKGILEAATAAGKCLVAAAIGHRVSPHMRLLVIVPNTNLANDMQKYFDKLGLDMGMIDGKLSKTKKEEVWTTNQHVVTTWQTLNRNREHLHEFDGFIYDEAHIMGDVMFDILVNDLAHAYLRIGMTGTVPPDKQKREKIMTRIGGGVFYNVEPKQLSDEGFISKAKIRMVETEQYVPKQYDDNGKEIWEWENESEYLLGNRVRVEAIGNFIQQTNIKNENVLILTHARFGKKLAQYLNCDFIDKDVSPEDRENCYKKFDELSNYNLVATYGTVGTGISINDIFLMFMIDVGKDYTKILQGIGRGCRLDSQNRNEVIVYDISSTEFFSARHKKKRITTYKKKQFDYQLIPTKITIN